jgi:hypothetical protein
MAAQDSAQATEGQRFSSAGSQQAQQAGPAQSSAASSEASMMDQLSQLSTLHQQGALTDDEFTAAKAKVLGG